MFFGKSTKIEYAPMLNGVPIEWVTEWRYLGVILKKRCPFWLFCHGASQIVLQVLKLDIAH